MSIAQQYSEAINKIFTDMIIDKNIAPSNTSNDDMLEQTGIIYAR